MKNNYGYAGHGTDPRGCWVPLILLLLLLAGVPSCVKGINNLEKQEKLKNLNKDNINMKYTKEELESKKKNNDNLILTLEQLIKEIEETKQQTKGTVNQ